MEIIETNLAFLQMIYIGIIILATFLIIILAIKNKMYWKWAEAYIFYTFGIISGVISILNENKEIFEYISGCIWIIAFVFLLYATIFEIIKMKPIPRPLLKRIKIKALVFVGIVQSCIIGFILGSLHLFQNDFHSIINNKSSFFIASLDFFFYSFICYCIYKMMCVCFTNGKISHIMITIQFIFISLVILVSLFGYIGIRTSLELFQSLLLVLNTNFLIIVIIMIYERFLEQKDQVIENIQIDKKQQLGLMVSSIAHDTTNFLSFISSSVEILLDNPLSYHTSEILSQIQIATKQAINSIKRFQNYDKGTENDYHFYSINSILDDVIELSQIGTKIEIIKNYNTNIPMIYGNYILLQNLFFNLILNAKQALQSQINGTIKIDTTQMEYDSRQSKRKNTQKINSYSLIPRYILVKIMDNGPGIPLNIQKNLFTPHFTTKKEGSGLGLVSCQSIIKFHHGNIFFKSQEGQGTEFDLEFPIFHENFPL